MSFTGRIAYRGGNFWRALSGLWESATTAEELGLVGAADERLFWKL